MSNTNSDSGVVASSPLYSASDISVSTTNVKSHWILDGDIEKQCYLQVPELPPFPEEWKPPSQTCARLCFTAICWFSVGKSDLEKFWREMEGKSWKEYNKLHDPPCTFNAKIFSLGIIFALWTPSEPLFVNQPGYTSIVDFRYYYIFLFMWLLCSFLGLSCEALRSLFHRSIELREQIEKEGQKQFQLSRHEVLIYVVLSRIAIFSPIFSLLCIMGCEYVRLLA